MCFSAQNTSGYASINAVSMSGITVGAPDFFGIPPLDLTIVMKERSQCLVLVLCIGL